MSNKRFITGKHYATINDTFNKGEYGDGVYYVGDEKVAKRLCALLNELYEKQ